MRSPFLYVITGIEQDNASQVVVIPLYGNGSKLISIFSKNNNYGMSKITA
jgi:hypothetical protein